MTDASTTPIAIIADNMSFRGASVAALFAPWARSIGCELLVATPGNLGAGSTYGGDIRFIVLNVGNMSLLGAEVRRWTQDIMLAFADTPCVVMSDRTEADEPLYAARMGMQAFIPSNAPPDIACRMLAFISNGGTYFAPSPDLMPRPCAETNQLTQRQVEVLALLRLGRSNKDIGRDLAISAATVKVHMSHIMRKLGVANRTQAALFMETDEFS